MPPLLDIRNLSVEFALEEGVIRVVEDVSLSVDEGRTVCLVGESGCGKSVTALSIVRLLPEPPARYAGGEILLAGRDMLRAGRRELREARGRMAGYIFQEPAASLHPVRRVGDQIAETLRLHQPGAAAREDVTRLLRQVRIADPEARALDYPFRLSGGMQQRVMLALALASRPRLLVADEPTTALDVTIQAQILELLRELQRDLGLGILFITHNLGVVAEMAHRVAVMYAGQIVESAPADDFFSAPQHPYTRALMRAAPRLGAPAEESASIPGTVPPPGAMPPGCRFEPRCPLRQPECALKPPALALSRPDHWVRCPVAAPPIAPPAVSLPAGTIPQPDRA